MFFIFQYFSEISNFILLRDLNFILCNFDEISTLKEEGNIFSHFPNLFTFILFSGTVTPIDIKYRWQLWTPTLVVSYIIPGWI